MLTPTQYHRCRNRQIFGGVTDFCPKFHKLPEKFMGHFLRIYFLMKTIFRMTSKESFLVSFLQIKARWSQFISYQITLGTIFTRIFRKFAQIFRDFTKAFTDFAQISKYFSRIFISSKLLRVNLHLCTPISCTTTEYTPNVGWCGRGWWVFAYITHFCVI